MVYITAATRDVIVGARLDYFSASASAETHLVRLDHDGIADDGLQAVIGLARCDYLPCVVPLELRQREAVPRLCRRA